MSSPLPKPTLKNSGTAHCRSQAPPTRGARLVACGYGSAVGCLLAALLATLLVTARPALAANSMTLSPGQGPAGAWVTVRPSITDPITSTTSPVTSSTSPVPSSTSPVLQSSTTTPIKRPAAFALQSQPSMSSPVLNNRTCSVLWDDRKVAQFTCGTDSTGQFAATDIRAQGPPGRHTISVICQPWCDDSSSPWQATAEFTTLSTVPDLTGLSYGDSRIEQRLTAAGLRLGNQTGPADPRATVVKQVPGIGAVVRPDNPVDVVFALPRIPLVRVPYLLKQNVDAAIRLINQHQLKLGTVTGAGLVIDQVPKAGSVVPPGTRVDLTLAAPPPRLVTVPDIRGFHVADATKTITDDGLVIDAGGATSGVVASQRPAPGRRVPPRSTVTATIRQPAVVLTASHRSTPPWAAVEIALLALACILISMAGWLALTRRRRPKTRKTSHRGAELPSAARHVDVRSRVSSPHLKTTTVGPTPSPVRVTVRGRDPNIKVKEVRK